MKERIKQVRLDSGLSQADFAKELKLTRNYLWMIEAGERTPGDRTISDISRIFGVNEVWLRTGVGEMKRPMTWQQEVTSYVNDLVKGNRTEFEETLIRFLAATTPEDWERLSVIFRKIQNEKKTEAE